MLDTRNEIRRLLDRFEFRSGKALLRSLVCLALAAAAIWLPTDPTLTESARWSLGIVVLAATLWISEAIPAFAVALLVIGLQVIILGRSGGVLVPADDARGWEIYVRPWASPPMWLFFGGLVLARAAQRTEIDQWVAGAVLKLTAGQPTRLLPAVMGVTFLFSMFMSNTATCAMMLTVLTPAIAVLPKDSAVAKALLLGLAFAANIGGMATIIGTPPNAIGAGFLEESGGISFTAWMGYGLPPALLLFAVIWWLLNRQMRSAGPCPALAIPEPQPTPPPPLSSHSKNVPITRWQRLLTLIIFVTTIGLWMTGALHGSPTAVVSFLPIVSLSMIGVMRAEEIRSLNWDVLILLAGGLSLGVGIESSGLAAWMAQQLQGLSAPPWVVTLTLCYVAAAASNLMSNTAAANILLPIGIVLANSAGPSVAAASIVVPVALSCSIAMALPIATPPNALIFASGRIATRDYLPGGLLALLIGPALCVAWAQLFN